MRIPSEFGGMGGISGGCDLDPENDFEVALDRAVGDRVRADRGMAEAAWCALANIEWFRDNGDTCNASFRRAGDIVAAIVGSGDYMDWYCCGDDGVVRQDIAEAMASEGWKWREPCPIAP